MDRADWQPTITFSLPAGWGQQEWAEWLQDLHTWLKADGRVSIAKATGRQEQFTVLAAVMGEDGELEGFEVTDSGQVWRDHVPQDPDEFP